MNKTDIFIEIYINTIVQRYIIMQLIIIKILNIMSLTQRREDLVPQISEL